MSATQSEDIIAGSRMEGLLPYLFRRPDPYSSASDTAFIDRVATLVSDGVIPLRRDGDTDSLAELKPGQFFAGLPFINRLIPRLDVGHREMMEFVAVMVDLGGEDLSATTPNGAFREWCAGDERRIQAVVDDARGGDGMALGFLCFALEAGSRSKDALDFLRSGGNQAVVAAAMALGRMRLDPSAAAKAVATLGDVCAHAEDVNVLNTALLSAWGLVGRDLDVPREGAVRALEVAVENAAPEARHAVASVLVRHGGAFNSGEMKIALNALKRTEPNHKGTIDQIDQSARSLIAGGWFEDLDDVVASVIRRSGGSLSLDEFPRFWEEIARNGYRLLPAIVVRWLLDDSTSLPTSLSKRLSRIIDDQVHIGLVAADLPSDVDSQTSLCRKAVGFLFLTPITAASLLVSVLEHGLPDGADEAEALLDDPLLVNFGGELVEYLESVTKACPKTVADRVNAVLKRAEDALRDLEGLVDLQELHPSEMKRRAVRVHEAKAMAEAIKQGSKRSIFHGLVKEEHLLYGRTASIYVDDPGAREVRKVDLKMAEHSVSMEIPRMAILDPEGLEIRLWQLKTGAGLRA